MSLSLSLSLSLPSILSNDTKTFSFSKTELQTVLQRQPVQKYLAVFAASGQIKLSIRHNFVGKRSFGPFESFEVQTGSSDPGWDVHSRVEQVGHAQILVSGRQSPSSRPTSIHSRSSHERYG